MEKYKIAFLISHPIQYQAPLFKKLSADNRIDLTVLFCSDHGVVDRYDPGFGRSFKLDIPVLNGYKYKFLKNFSPKPSVSVFWGLLNFSVAKEIWSGGYDAVIIHGYVYATNWIAFFTAWFAGTPVFFRGETVLRPNRSWYIKFFKKIVVSMLRLISAAFLSINSRSREFYIHYGVRPERIFDTPYAVENERFERSPEILAEAQNVRRGLNIPEEALVMLFVGKLISKKRPFDLLFAYEKIITSGRFDNEPYLVFLGDGALRRDLEKYISSRGLSKVRLTGFINQSALPAHYAAAQMFILPSTDQEVSPLVINEAMASGLPVLVSAAIPSAYDFVEQGVNGFIFEMGDVDTLTEKLSLLVGDEKLRKQMSEASLRLIKRWNYDESVVNIVEALKKYSKNKNG